MAKRTTRRRKKKGNTLLILILVVLAIFFLSNNVPSDSAVKVTARYYDADGELIGESQSVKASNNLLQSVATGDPLVIDEDAYYMDLRLTITNTGTLPFNFTGDQILIEGVALSSAYDSEPLYLNPGETGIMETTLISVQDQVGEQSMELKFVLNNPDENIVQEDHFQLTYKKRGCSVRSPGGTDSCGNPVEGGITLNEDGATFSDPSAIIDSDFSTFSTLDGADTSSAELVYNFSIPGNVDKVGSLDGNPRNANFVELRYWNHITETYETMKFFLEDKCFFESYDSDVLQLKLKMSNNYDGWYLDFPDRVIREVSLYCLTHNDNYPEGHENSRTEISLSPHPDTTWDVSILRSDDLFGDKIYGMKLVWDFEDNYKRVRELPTTSLQQRNTRYTEGDGDFYNIYGGSSSETGSVYPTYRWNDNRIETYSGIGNGGEVSVTYNVPEGATGADWELSLNGATYTTSPVISHCFTQYSPVKTIELTARTYYSSRSRRYFRQFRCSNEGTTGSWVSATNTLYTSGFNLYEERVRWKFN